MASYLYALLLLALFFVVKSIAKRFPAFGIAAGSVLMVVPIVVWFTGDFGAGLIRVIAFVLFGVIGFFSFAIGANMVNTSIRALRGEDVEALEEAARIAALAVDGEFVPEKAATPALGWLMVVLTVVFFVGAFSVVSKGCSGEGKTGELEIPPMVNGVDLSVVALQRVYGASVWDEYVVACRSDSTASAPGEAKDKISRGQTLVARIPYTALRGGEPLGQAVGIAKEALVYGDGWIAWTRGALRISFDRCATWREFVPWEAIPSGEIGRNCASPECAKVFLDTTLDNRVRYKDLVVEGKDRIEFTLHSDALADSSTRRVSTIDGGKTWQIEAERHQPTMYRRLGSPRGAEFFISQTVGKRNSLRHTLTCSSAATQASPAQPDKGVSAGSAVVDQFEYRGLGSSSPVQRNEALDFWESVASRNLDFGDGWIVWTLGALRVTFDQCATWRVFEPWTVLPPSEVMTGEGKPCPDKSCAKEVFLHQQVPQYTEVRIEPAAGTSSRSRVSFIMRSRHLRDSELRYVSSGDGGAAWQVAVRQ